MRSSSFMASSAWSQFTPLAAERGFVTSRCRDIPRAGDWRWLSFHRHMRVGELSRATGGRCVCWRWNDWTEVCSTVRKSTTSLPRRVDAGRAKVFPGVIARLPVVPGRPNPGTARPRSPPPPPLAVVVRADRGENDDLKPPRTCELAGRAEFGALLLPERGETGGSAIVVIGVAGGCFVGD